MASVRLSRRVRFESLEQRQLLAGDVMINVDNGHLSVEGDELDNKILITAGAEPGSYVITGLDGTNLIQDGQAPASEVTVTGVRGASIRLNEGADLVGIAGASFRGHVAINTGTGEDRVFVGTGGDAAELAGLLPADPSVNVRRSLTIKTGDDNDQVSVDNASVGRGLTIRTGQGDDTADLGSTEPVTEADARLRVRGGVHVKLGDGMDELNMDQVRSRHGIIVHGGAGDDTVNATTVSSHFMAVLDDAGMDTVSLSGLDVRHLGIHTGADADNVDVQDSVFATLGVSLGDGNDTLTTSALEARVAVLLGGDGDEDTLNVLSENQFNHELIRGFEVPPDVNTSNSFRRLARIFGRLR